MQITIKFRDTEARGAHAYLKKYYNSRAGFEQLAKQAIRDIVAKQARVELDRLAIELKAEVNHA